MMQQASAPPDIIDHESRSLGPIASFPRIASKFWSEALIVVIAALLWMPRLSGPIDLRWDASVYYLLGTSITNGHGYRIESEPGSPAALQYPPLLPLIISLHQRAVGSTDPAVVGPWLRITYAFLFLLYALAVLRLAKRYLRAGFAVVATLLCLLNPFTIFLSDLLFAEVPFALISVGFALVAGAVGVRRQWWQEVSSFVLAASAFLLRSIGVALLSAWVLDALLRRRWRLFCARAVVSLLPVLGWQAYVSHVRGTTNYSHPAYEYQRAAYQYYNVSYLENMRLVDPFRPELGTLTAGSFLARVATNVTMIPVTMGQIISAKEKDWRGAALWLQGLVSHHRLFPVGSVIIPIFALAVFAIAGLLVFMQRRDWIMAFIIIGSFAVLCVTPWPQQFTRYLEPLAPFLTIAAVVGIEKVSQWLARGRVPRAAPMMRWTAGVILVLAIVVELHTAAWLFSERARQPVAFSRTKSAAAPKWFLYDQSWRAWQEAIDWIDIHAGRGAITATSSPHFYYLQTGRLAVLPPMAPDPAEERRLLAAVPVSHAIVDELEFLDTTRRYLQPAVTGDPAAWHLVYTADGTSVYERGP